MNQHGGVVFFAGYGHKVEEGRRGGTENKDFSLFSPGFTRGDILVGKVLEGASGIGDVVAALEVDLIAPKIINGNSLGGTEAEFFAGLEVVDLFFACCLNIADDGVGENDLVRFPAL